MSVSRPTKPLKIAVVSSLVTRLQPAQLGGAQAFLCDLATGLSQRGHEVLLYCAEGSVLPGVDLVEIPVAPGADQALVMPGSSDEPAASPAMRRAFELLFKELRRLGADVVSQHAFDAEAIEMSDGLPVLHTLHLPPISNRVLGEVLKSRAAFATVSESCRRAWAKAGAAHVSVIRNGVPVFTVEEVPIREDALLAGRLSPEKGFEDGIAAARAIGLRPVVVGVPYDQSYQLDLEGAVALPPQPRSQLWRLMAGARVTLLPVHWDEPFGMVCAEAQMAGCPVAGYSRGGLVEIVEPGVSGFLSEPGEVKGLAAAALAATKLDRAAVRASAVNRLGLDASLDAYEAALAVVAG
ncbi:MAG TPA: glycosyltransferase [Methylomirabilota bacterium]|nr:glycosyltransferase [Methylomirabilota bacterium]